VDVLWLQLAPGGSILLLKKGQLRCEHTHPQQDTRGNSNKGPPPFLLHAPQHAFRSHETCKQGQQGLQNPHAKEASPPTSQLQPQPAVLSYSSERLGQPPHLTKTINSRELSNHSVAQSKSKSSNPIQRRWVQHQSSAPVKTFCCSYARQASRTPVGKQNHSKRSYTRAPAAYTTGGSLLKYLSRC